jgi:hypothetical protein
MSIFKSNAVSNTSALIKGQGADVYTYNILNRHSATIYVRFYNSSSATFQDSPLLTVAVPANLSLRDVSDRYPLVSSSNALCVRAVTEAADNGTTSPATLPEVYVDFN